MSTCSRKVRHPRRKAARKAARILRRRGVIGANAYYCEECGGWHVGKSGAMALFRRQLHLAKAA
jgi:hypothetical protein